MRSSSLLLTVALVATAAPAHAGPGAAPDLWSVPAPRQVVARAVVEAELTRHRVLTPLTLAPDLGVGVSDRLGVLVRHSRSAEARTGVGNGFCIVPSSEALHQPLPSCPEIDTGLGVTGLVEVADRPGGALTGRFGVTARHVTPLRLALEMGAAAQLQRGRLWLLTAPTVILGLNGPSDSNRDRLAIPVYLGVGLDRGVELHVRTGFEATLHTFFDTYAVPLGAGASVEWSRYRVGAEICLDKAIGPLNATTWRSANAYVQARFGGAR